MTLSRYGRAKKSPCGRCCGPSRIAASYDPIKIVRQEETMTRSKFGRRDIIKLMAGAGAIGVSAAPTLWPLTAKAAAPAYNPAGKFELDVKDVELRRNPEGRMLMARIYQPKGPGPFPTILDLHGG